MRSSGGRPSEDDTAPAEPLPAASHGRRRGDGGKVGMDFDVRELRLKVTGSASSSDPWAAGQLPA